MRQAVTSVDEQSEKLGWGGDVMEPPGSVDIDQMEWFGDDLLAPPTGLSNKNAANKPFVVGAGDQDPVFLSASSSRQDVGIKIDIDSSGSACAGKSTLSGVLSASSATSADAAGGARKPPCRYGRGCSHTSTFHRTRYSHPNDAQTGKHVSGGSNGTVLACAAGSGGRDNRISAATGVNVVGGGVGGAGGGFVCNECGMDFGSVKELQLHMVRKTAWSNQGLVGCRVSCLVDNREWHEGLVTQVLNLPVYCLLSVASCKNIKYFVYYEKMLY